MAAFELLWPRPKELVLAAGACLVPARATITRPAMRDLDPVVRHFVREARRRGIDALDVESPAARPAATIRIDVDARHAIAPGGYRLVLGGEIPAIDVRTRDAAGARHALATLAQILDLYAVTSEGRVGPAVRVDDAPDFAARGVLLDVSRGRVPRLETLFDLVERLAAFKVNQLQLYGEHVFAYRGHEVVWRDAGAFTADDMRALDAHCAERGIELVPNQQSFGHMHRWLKHEAYRDLAEVPEGVDHAFSLEREPYSLCLADPRALALLEDLYDQLAPCFTSRALNVGLDETFDLGLGRSKARCAERGVARVYLEYLLAVRERVVARGRRMQFWADIVLRHPTLIGELPRDVVALAWGYDADHPFAEQVQTLRQSGIPFYVCPGTSSWQSFAGRTDVMMANVRAAAEQGRRAGAEGLLVTDWGDRGHHQPHFVKEAGLLAAAGLAWNVDAARDLDGDSLAALLDHHVFEDHARVLGRAALDLGRTHALMGSPATNGSALFFLVAFAPEAFPHARTPALAREGLARARRHALEVEARLASARSSRPDAGLLVDEFRWASAALVLAADLGRERLEAGLGTSLGDVPAAARGALAARFQDLGREHARLWRQRDREPGLHESLRWFERVRAGLDGGPDANRAGPPSPG